MLHILVTLMLVMPGQTPVLEVAKQTVKSGIHIQTLVLNVRGQLGRRPRELAQSDITILENGVVQPISVFVRHTENPKVTRYELGYTVTDPTPGLTKRVEIRVRGLRRKLVAEFTSR